jgi:hypothetical protein
MICNMYYKSCFLIPDHINLLPLPCYKAGTKPLFAKRGESTVIA